MSEQSNSNGHGENDHGKHGHGSMGLYLSVFGILCVLTIISFVIGSNSPLKENAPIIAMVGMLVVSCAKALLVMLFFMHLRWEANWKYVLTIPASIMAIFLILMLVPDIGWRTEHYSTERWRWAPDVQVEADHQGKDNSSKHEH